MNTLEGAQNHALTYSGLLPFTSAGQKTLMMALHDQMMGWAKKYATNKLPRRFRDQLKNAGLTDAEIDAALVMYRNEDIVKPQQGTVFKKVEDIDQSHPAFDGELFWKVKDAFARMTTQAIQENKWGMMPPGWDHPVTRILFQIRSFMVGSITAQLINNTRKMGSTVARGIRDVKAGNFSMEDGLGDSMMDLMRVGGSTVGQSISGIMGYVALQAMYAQTMTDEEAERHWEKIWDVEHLALAAVSRSGWLGSIPFIYDSTVGMVTGTKFAGYRSSGLAEDVFGNPTFGMFRDITRVVQGVTGDDDMDAKDAQNIQKMFTNMWYANLGTMFVSRNVFGLEAPESRDDPVSLIGRLMGKED